MRFMTIVTSPQPMTGPTPALMEAMGKLAEREFKAGRMIDMGGLMPLQQGARVSIADGKLTMTDSDLEIVDQTPRTPLEFSLAEYNRQLVADYSKNTPSHGLIVCSCPMFPR